MSIYFNAATAQEQIACLLDMSPPDWVGVRVALTEIDEATQMFTEPSEVFKLQDLYNDLNITNNISQPQTSGHQAVMPYLALIILYTYSPNFEGHVENHSEVHKLNQDARQMLFSFLTASQVLRGGFARLR